MLRGYTSEQLHDSVFEDAGYLLVWDILPIHHIGEASYAQHFQLPWQKYLKLYSILLIPFRKRNFTSCFHSTFPP